MISYLFLQLQPIVFPKLSINHHIVISKCKRDINESVYGNLEGQIFPCYDVKDPRHFLIENCKQFFAISSILSEEPLSFPDNVGITIDPLIPYFLVAAHLPNPTDQTLTVSATTKIWTTS